MIRRTLEVTLTLILRVLIRLARIQSAEHLVVSLKVARRGCEKKQKARRQPSVAWKIRSSVWELRFGWRRNRLTQGSGPPSGRWAISRKGRSVEAKAAHPAGPFSRIR